jgi:Fur family ferric uptake transcriptional regulator
MNNTNTQTKIWLEALQASGYRLTAPRRAIVELLTAAPRALSPIQVFDRARRFYPGLGLVTVYRTLEKLEDLGLLQRVHTPDGCHRYMPTAEGHQHLLVCTDCGQVRYFSGDDFKRLAGSISQETGYEVTDHWLQFYGLCPECSAQRENDRNSEN